MRNVMKKYVRLTALVLYDLIILFGVGLLLQLFNGGSRLTTYEALVQIALAAVCVTSVRFIGRVYNDILRFGGIQCYIRLMLTDFFAFLLFFILEILLPIQGISFVRILAMFCMNLIGALAMRMIYRYAYKCADQSKFSGKVLALLFRIFSGKRLDNERINDAEKTPVAIIGAGRVGMLLSEELTGNPASSYAPLCFVDANVELKDRAIHGIPVLFEDEHAIDTLRELKIEEVVFAIHGLDDEKKKVLYNRYLEAGFKLKVYDYPAMQNEGKRQLREFDIDELLLRKPITFSNELTREYYKGKVILITGGGGSIGSELCRQIAGMSPEQIIILDIYENGAYDVQQELRIAHKGTVDIRIEVASITNRRAMEKVFETYHPDIVINAAAHKHVPLMEHNCVEAVENNVFGTELLVMLCEKYGTERFMMVSTDKAVNPTNVMGATKRMCEMIVLSASARGRVKYSATRFGNVLGSAGSVIPLFKKQIASGGPITITDKRIVRYFMTIPEASQLVLESGAMAKNGELFVLDMGQPVRIYDMAKTMIRLSGVRGVEIVETGLREGEKLYEELLIKTEELTKTENSLIYIERDTPYSEAEIKEKLSVLRTACLTNDDDIVRDALKKVVPTYRSPEEVNSAAEHAEEMKTSKTLITA